MDLPPFSTEQDKQRAVAFARLSVLRALADVQKMVSEAGLHLTDEDQRDWIIQQIEKMKSE